MPPDVRSAALGAGRLGFVRDRRDTTERPETVECGSNILCGTSDPVRMLDELDPRLIQAGQARWAASQGRASSPSRKRAKTS